MQTIRKTIGGLGNLLFKQAFLYTLMREGVIPDLYVQDEKFFGKYRDEVKQMFGEGITPGVIQKVSLHIRRGDYVNNPFYVNLWETDYYKKAIEEFPKKKYLVFCRDNQGRDGKDRQWCLDNLPALLGPLSERWEFAPDQDEIADLNLMASCRGHIMANSSFSWWAAYLGGGKTVCPLNWFSDGIQRIGLLDNWIKI